MTTRATEDLLGKIHEALASELLSRIESGEATPAELNAAIKFLQNNNIDCIPTQDSTVFKLAEVVPFPNDDEEAFG